MSKEEPIEVVAERYSAQRYGSRDEEEWDEIFAPVRLLDDRVRLANWALARLSADAIELEKVDL